MQVKVYYLRFQSTDYYTDGQSSFKQPQPMNRASRDYYLATAPSRGLALEVEESTMQIDDQDAESAREAGWEIV